MMAALPALALLAGGLALIFYVLPPLIDSIAGLGTVVGTLFDKMITGAPGVFMMAGAIAALGAAFFFLGNMALMATLGIAAGTIALVALRISMALSGTSFSDLMKIGKGVKSMGEGISKLKSGLSGLGSAARSIFGAIGNKNLMITSDGTMTTVVAGKGGMFMMMPQKITVDVNMDDANIAAPQVDVKVVLDGEQLRHIISEEVARNR